MRAKALWAFFYLACLPFVHLCLSRCICPRTASTNYLLSRRRTCRMPQIRASPRMSRARPLSLANIQASLGITTLLSCTPLHLAAAHQAGALTVLASSMWTAHSLRFARVPSTMPSAGPPPSSPQSSPSPLLNLPPIAPRTTVNPRGLDEVTSSAVPDMSSSDGGFGGGSSSRA